MRKILIAVLVFSFSATISKAGEGMWLPLLLKSLNEAEMQQLGMKLTAEDIYSVNKGSLKDAIVHFGGFCTAEVISDRGLLLTNHHCGYSQIQSHSSIDNNLLKDGFWADGTQEELPNPGLFARFIERIEDVTSLALSGVREDMTETERQSQIDKNIAGIKAKYTTTEFQEIMVRPFFKGNQYFLFQTVSYPDVRLVGTPPESVGKFGSDTDNWVWPRHTGDFSLFRIYAGPNNEPAAYSVNNKPYTPKHFLPISLDGITEDDFTMVLGFPGRTDEYLPSYAVDQLLEKRNPAKISIRDKALSIIDKYMRSNEETRIKYASKFARIANYWKKWIGESQGLKSTGALEKKRTYEADFTNRVKANPNWRNKYGDLLPAFKNLYGEMADLAYTTDYFSEFKRNVEISRIAGLANRLIKAHAANDQETFDDLSGRVKAYLPSFYKNYISEIDMEVFSALLQMYFENVDSKYIGEEARRKLATTNNNYDKLAKNLFVNTALISEDKFTAIIDLGMSQAAKVLTADPMVRFLASLNEHHNTTVGKPYNELKKQLNQKMRLYMQAQMEVFSEKTFYPDANSTLRVTYGQVKGYEPRDAVTYKSQTFLSGVIEKYQPGDYEFDLPKKLIELAEKKDFGQYAQDGKLPVCFIGTNHTTGGNSGSPVIDAYGNLVGLNFDRVWEGTMSDINYDASICRNIMVDTRYILFIVDKYAGASHLINEMKLVNPKSKPMTPDMNPANKNKQSIKKNKGKVGTKRALIRQKSKAVPAKKQ